MGEYEISWMDSVTEKANEKILTLLPPPLASPAHNSVLVGDLKLADFKQFLSTKGIQVQSSCLYF